VRARSRRASAYGRRATPRRASSTASYPPRRVVVEAVDHGEEFHRRPGARVDRAEGARLRDVGLVHQPHDVLLRFANLGVGAEHVVGVVLDDDRVDGERRIGGGAGDDLEVPVRA